MLSALLFISLAILIVLNIVQAKIAYNSLMRSKKNLEELRKKQSDEMKWK